MTVRTTPVPRPRTRERDGGDLAAAAASALALVETDPDEAGRLAGGLVRRTRLPPDVRATAFLALGRVAWSRRDVGAALTALRAAARAADRAGRPDLSGQARLTLAAVLAERGQGRAALRALAAAEPHLAGIDLGRLAGQRAYLHYLEGRLAESLAGHEAAYAQFRRLGDERRQAVALHNMAVVHAQSGALGRAAEELRQAYDLFDRVHERLHAADAAANLGWVLARQGSVPEALRWFDAADAVQRAHGEIDPQATKDRAEALLVARLLPEARDAADAAAAAFEQRRMPAAVAECRLLAARAALLRGELAAAREHASAAGRAAGSRRPALRALAVQLVVAADVQGGVTGEAALRARRSVLRVASVLEGQGWRLHALDARITAARLALAGGRPRAARGDLATVTAARGGGIQVRIAAAHARALLHVVEGDPREARAALRTGVRDLDRYRLSLGATELQTLATGHGLELLGLGLDLALDAGDAWQALGWSERGRAASLRSAPPADPDLLEALDALRQSAAATERALLDGEDPRRPLARQVALEQQVRRRSLTVSGRAVAVRDLRMQRGDLRRALGEASLLQLVEHRGRAFGVLVRGSAAGRPGTVLRDLGQVEAVAPELDALRFAAARLARGTGSPRALDAAAASYAEAARRIDAALLAPFAELLGDRPLVLTPSGAWHAVPWAALPACAGRVVTVAPSTRLWLRTAAGATAGTRDGRVVVAAGPGLAHASTEVAGVVGVHPHARPLVGDAATAGAVLAALDGTALAHIAAHGSFRTDNPQLSALRLVDGPLTIYDLETLGRPPQALVLTACDLGLSHVRSGEEVQGFAAALLTLGARAVVASLAPVADDLAAGFAVELHRELRTSSSLAGALAGVQARWRDRGAREASTAQSFVCFGGG